MKKLMLALGVVLLFATQIAAASSYRYEKMRYDTWLEVCEYTHYSCTNVDVPKVKYKWMGRGLLGQYKGGDTVDINRSVSWSQKRATLYHEMIHYLQAKVGGLRVPGPAKEICEAEAEAFAEGDKRWERMGQSHKKRGPDWWKPYRHCRRFYGGQPSGPFWF